MHQKQANTLHTNEGHLEPKVKIAYSYHYDSFKTER